MGNSSTDLGSVLRGVQSIQSCLASSPSCQPNQLLFLDQEEVWMIDWWLMEVSTGETGQVYSYTQQTGVQMYTTNIFTLVCCTYVQFYTD